MVSEVFSKLIDSLIVCFCLSFHDEGIVCSDKPEAVLSHERSSHVSVSQVVMEPQGLELVVVLCGPKCLHQLVLTSHHNLSPTSFSKTHTEAQVPTGLLF